MEQPISKYQKTYDIVSKDLKQVLTMFDQWENDFPDQDYTYKVNMGMLANKIVNFICAEMPNKCDDGLEYFIKHIEIENDQNSSTIN